MDIQVGDKVVVMVQAIDGTLAGFSYFVKGIYHSGSQTLDELTIFVTLSSAQELLGLEGAIHEIVIRLKARKMMERYLQWLREKTIIPGL